MKVSILYVLSLRVSSDVQADSSRHSYRNLCQSQISMAGTCERLGGKSRVNKKEILYGIAFTLHFHRNSSVSHYRVLVQRELDYNGLNGNSYTLPLQHESSLAG
jgi:hypothetical protein